MNNKLRKKKINRRIFILGFFYIIATLVLTVKLYFLQIKNNKKYKTLSNNNRTKLVFLPPPRGKILDRNKAELATSKRLYKVLYNPKYISNIDQIIDNLISITKLPISESLANKMKSTSSVITVYDEISWQKLTNIEFNIEKLPGIYIIPFDKRYYPFGKICSHIIGYIKVHNQSTFKRNLGVNGIEQKYDTELKGKAGTSEQEIDSKRRVIKQLSHTSAQPGENIILTIDINFQKVASELLNNSNGAITVIDIKSGDVLALYSSPSYDNNSFINGISNAEWKAVNNNINLPLINRNISLQTEPASTFKIITALTALENKVIDKNTKINCSGTLVIGDTKFSCWNHKGHGQLNVSQAITVSCNTYFYTIAQKLNIDMLVEMASKFGLGKISNIQLPGEVAGIIPSQDWRENKLNTRWHLGDTVNVAIGHGYLLVTPIQLAIIAARIASGKQILPNINASQTHTHFLDLDVNINHIQFMNQCLFKVVNSSIGTAANHIRKSGILPLVQMSGKTGSAQVISAKSENIKLLKKQTKNKNHGIFIGYGPSYKPKYAISVFMEHIGDNASKQAAAIAQQMFNYIFNSKT